MVQGSTVSSRPEGGRTEPEKIRDREKVVKMGDEKEEEEECGCERDGFSHGK